MPTLYLVRHGKTEHNNEEIIIGQNDSPLLTTSLEAIKSLAHKLKNISFTKIYSSSLGRAYRTAQIISDELASSLDVITMDVLKEIDYGELSGRQKKRCEKRFSSVS